MKDRKSQIIEEYEINPNTMMIMPIEYGSKVYARIYELEDEILSPFKPIDIIKKSCRFFGASYEGRKEGTRQLTGITHKSPITIDPTNLIYFFPTASASNSSCIWISYENVHHYEPVDGGMTEVIFKNRQAHIIPVSHNIFQNQILRTALLKTTLNSRIEESERKAIYFFKRKKEERMSEHLKMFHK
ncbi:competence protein ComK [Cytobacillus horneckiae]|uniref:Transcriptional regulator n=1 Tax=Cytobacillus horneckiae TaxID=549687 RepID=A0A2N0Z932_9BACI|nr:competence protein ComK [Cytobacillus horneckiae]MBN6887604.1 competence protein ComK [Cytobacillus horneckiae]MCM3178663.1 competence protein ComK [Cytobacillus horneckiae]MEC1157595.1 competence protein ComK [Cytobacillus horneckiae]MED2939250.1 competence protein ComK [Cytobacillus horneckiae]PKG26009.1 transcriptional regulator [Cytobacillus horneckiae]